MYTIFLCKFSIGIFKINRNQPIVLTATKHINDKLYEIFDQVPLIYLLSR